MNTYGVIGWPIKHSLSPEMHNAAFKAFGIDAVYEKIPVKPEELEVFLLGRKDLAGFNVTIPHKLETKIILERNFPSENKASQVNKYSYYVNATGAVNTVKRDGDKIEYWNTDVDGFLHALEQDLNFDTRNKNVLLIGCGGAGRAVIAGLSWKNTKVNKIYVFDSSKEAVESTSAHFQALSPEWRSILDEKVEFIPRQKVKDMLQESQLLVNASPIGMEGDDIRPVIEMMWLHKDLYVYDLVYNRKTRLVKDAEMILGRSRASDGRGMLAYQGSLGFSFWTGRDPKEVAPVMRARLDTLLKERCD